MCQSRCLLKKYDIENRKLFPQRLIDFEAQYIELNTTCLSWLFCFSTATQKLSDSYAMYVTTIKSVSIK